MGLFELFGRKKKPDPNAPSLTREESFAARPVLNTLVKTRRDEDGKVILQIPRRDTGTVRWVARIFGLPPYKRVALDELGSFVIEMCDGEHTVREIVDKFAREFKLNRREAEVSTSTFLRELARRSIVGLVLEERPS